MLAFEKKKKNENQRRARLLQAYWVVAAAASLAVLTQVRWPSAPSAPAIWVFISVLASMLIAPVLLLMRQRSNLEGLVNCVFAGELNDPNEAIRN